MDSTPRNGRQYGMIRVQPATHRRLMSFAGDMQARIGRRATADLVINSALDALAAELPARPDTEAAGTEITEQ